MANTYAGRATLVVGEREWSVTVQLHKREDTPAGLSEGLTDWGGRVLGLDSVAASDAMDAGSLVLRLPNGREGQVMVRDATVHSGDWTVVDVVSAGADSPPF